MPVVFKNPTYFVVAPLRKGKAPFRVLSVRASCVPLPKDILTILPELRRSCLTLPLGTESSPGSNNTTEKLWTCPLDLFPVLKPVIACSSHCRWDVIGIPWKFCLTKPAKFLVNERTCPKQNHLMTKDLFKNITYKLCSNNKKVKFIKNSINNWRLTHVQFQYKDLLTRMSARPYDSDVNNYV